MMSSVSKPFHFNGKWTSSFFISKKPTKWISPLNVIKGYTGPGERPAVIIHIGNHEKFCFIPLKNIKYSSNILIFRHFDWIIQTRVFEDYKFIIKHILLRKSIELQILVRYKKKIVNKYNGMINQLWFSNKLSQN